MIFSVGDRVRIITTDCENNGHGPHYGMIGTVKSVSKFSKEIPYVVIRDHYPNEMGICYSEASLEPWGHTKMTPPDMALDEIELAEKALEELNSQRG